jgi:hypothetical protein
MAVADFEYQFPAARRNDNQRAARLKAGPDLEAAPDLEEALNFAFKWPWLIFLPYRPDFCRRKAQRAARARSGPV